MRPALPTYALSPQQALKFVENGGVPPPAEHILDFAATGLAQPQARVMETVSANVQRDDASHADITTDPWKRIAREGQGDAMWNSGPSGSLGPTWSAASLRSY